MITPVVQRWRDRRDSYRPAGEVIATHRYEVARIDDDNTAKAFVLQHHYDASYPAAILRFGLFCSGELVGVAVFAHPFPTAIGDLPGERRFELSRFVLLDEVPANGETFFLGRVFRLLRGDVDAVLSFSDPNPRTNIVGATVFKGHLGVIYTAFNGIYRGQGEPRTVRLLPDGHVFSARAISKIRAGEKGWRYAAANLERFGAPPLEAPELGRDWLATWLPKITRTRRGPGNHRYHWAVDKRLRRAVEEAARKANDGQLLAYPKF